VGGNKTTYSRENDSDTGGKYRSKYDSAYMQTRSLLLFFRNMIFFVSKQQTLFSTVCSQLPHLTVIIGYWGKIPEI